MLVPATARQPLASAPLRASLAGRAGRPQSLGRRSESSINGSLQRGVLSGHLGSVPYPVGTCRPWNWCERSGRTGLASCGLRPARFCMSGRPWQAQGIVAQNKRIRMPAEGLRCRQLSTAERIERRDDRLVAGC